MVLAGQKERAGGMFGFFEGFAERQFRKFVRQILVTNAPDFEKIEGILPHSTVETAYKTAWAQFGKPSHNKHPSIYRDQCAIAAEYVADFFTTALGLLQKADPPSPLDAPKTLMDQVSRVAYGDGPTKSASCEQASRMAYQELLFGKVSLGEVQALAKELSAGPIPYSTHDLAASVSLNFFKRPELVNDLNDAQLKARATVAGWAREGKVISLLAQTFEAVLQQRYKSIDAGTIEKGTSAGDFSQKLKAFRTKNKNCSPNVVAQAVKSFMIWQHNSMNAKKLETDYFENQEKYPDETTEKMMENAFMHGAAMAAFGAYSLDETQMALFVENVIGMYRGLSDEAQLYSELEEVLSATEIFQEMEQAGSGLMLGYLIYGKQDEHRFDLAALMGF